MTPPPFDPENPQPPGRFRIYSAVEYNVEAETNDFTATCTIHGEIYKFTASVTRVEHMRDMMEKLRPALFRDHLKNFHKNDPLSKINE